MTPSRPKLASTRFGPCEICLADDWRPVYSGPIRDGAFGGLEHGAAVARCGGCGVERLDEALCPDDAFYETAEYREKLGQGLQTEDYFATHDELQIFALETLLSTKLRGRTIADIGCAGGSFLDHVAGVADRLIAVEPFSAYHPSLRERGYQVYPDALAAAAECSGEVDVAVSFQVVEHVRNPRQFLSGIRPLLKPDGRLLVSTPNRRDILMELLPDDFRAFFYRKVHRWYFDGDSLAGCAQRAGFEVAETRFVHQFGLSNAVAWLRDRRPAGRRRLPPLDATIDQLWKSWLEATGRSDRLFVLLRPHADSR